MEELKDTVQGASAEENRPEDRSDINPLLGTVGMEEFFSTRERREAAFALADKMAAEPGLTELGGLSRSDYLLDGAYEAVVEVLELAPSEACLWVKASPFTWSRAGLLKLAIELCPFAEGRTARALELLDAVRELPEGGRRAEAEREVCRFLAERIHGFEGVGALRIRMELARFVKKGNTQNNSGWERWCSGWEGWFRGAVSSSEHELARCADAVSEWITSESEYRARLAKTPEMEDLWEETLAQRVADYEAVVNLTAAFIEELSPGYKDASAYRNSHMDERDFWFERVLNDAISPAAIRRAVQAAVFLIDECSRVQVSSRNRGEWLAELCPYAQDAAEAEDLARRIAEFCEARDVEVNGLPAEWWWGMAGEGEASQ